ncbi:MAG: hypothetical protein GY859_29075, partial [Desulfobacterales bacterium]|nr:hypothetical protein [Desulfobacterales bacterium]
VTVLGETARQYHLVYEMSPSSSRSLLSEVRMDPLPPILIDYHQRSGATITPAFSIAAQQPAMPWQMNFEDADGDSLPDLLIRDIWTHDPGPPDGPAQDGPAQDPGVWDYVNLHAYNWESREYQPAGQYRVERGKGYLAQGCVLFGDVDGDQRQDLLFRTGGDDVVKVAFANGGSASNVLPFGKTDPDKILIGDISGEGRADLVTISGLTNGYYTIYTYLSKDNGDGTFQFEETPVATTTSECGIGDRFAILSELTGDSRQDLISWDNRLGKICTWVGREDGSFGPVNVTTSVDLGLFNPSGDLVEINGDGIVDFVSNDIEHTGEFYIFLGKGDGGFVKMPTFSTGSFDIEEVKFGGLDIGGAQDLIVKIGSYYHGYMAKWDGGFHPEAHRLWQSTTLHPEYFHLKDLNNDGLVDVFMSTLGDSSRSALILGDYGQADAAPQCPDNAFCWGVFLADNGHQ